MMNVAQCTVSAWEIGQTNPTAEKLPKLARLYGCSVDDLLDPEEPESEVE